jgi:hypothetical protein
MIHSRSLRSQARSIRWLVAGIYIIVASVQVVATVRVAVAAQPTETAGSQGIWKARMPSVPMKGEFDSFDPIGVAAGAKIKADCSLNWTNPDDGKRYCFSSGTSLVMFLDRPHGNILRAEKSWQKLQHRS